MIYNPYIYFVFTTTAAQPYYSLLCLQVGREMAVRTVWMIVVHTDVWMVFV